MEFLFPITVILCLISPENAFPPPQPLQNVREQTQNVKKHFHKYATGRGSDILDQIFGFTGNETEAAYNHSHAFREWFNNTLKTYDNRLRPHFGVRPIMIELGLILIGISSISEANMEFTVEMFLHETWTDHRLTFRLEDVGGKSPITLPLDAPRIFWTPDTTFLNARRSKAPEEGSVSHLHYMKLHQNGTLSYSRRLSVTAECKMNLAMYPFDQQACSLELSSYGWTIDDVLYKWALAPKSINLGELLLPDFEALTFVASIFNRTYVAGDFSIAKLCFVLKRRSGFCILQLFVPATAVVGSSWISLWLESETQFADMVAVILAIIFLSYSYNNVMPKVSYIKAMDIYLGACFIFAFLSLVKLAIVKYMHHRVKKRKEQHQEAMLAHSNSAGKLGENGAEEIMHLLTLDATNTNPNSAQSTPMKRHASKADLGPRLTVASKLASASRTSINRMHHDMYWRCMKAFHVISQLTLPLAFGAFGVFFFFIYPYVQEHAVC